MSQTIKKHSMKTIKVIIFALLIIIGLALIVAVFLPKDVYFDKKQLIAAPEAVIFNQINNLQNWDKWSPFQSDDMTSEYEGPKAGVGAKHTWKSEEMGNGTLTVQESKPHTLIKNFLDFGEDGTSVGSWEFSKTDDGVEVTWGMSMSDLSWPVNRILGLMMPGMMDPYFVKGLQNLKDTCEAMPDYSGIKEITSKPLTSYAINDSCLITDMEAKMGEVYGKLVMFFQTNNLEMAGVPYCMYHTWNPESYIHFEAAIPVVNTIGNFNEIMVSGIKEQSAIEYLHIGSYDDLGLVHELMGSYLLNCGFEMAGSPWEEYITDPTTETDPAKWQTRIVYPVK